MATLNTRLDIAKEFLRNPFLTFLLFLIGGIIISIAPDKTTQLFLYSSVGIILLFAIGIYITYYERISRQRITEKYAKLESEKQEVEKQLACANKEIQRQPRVAYYNLAQKTAKVTNADTGDADVHYYFECKNARNILRTMRHEIRYDAKDPLKKDQITALVDGVSADFTCDTVTNCTIKGNDHIIKKFETSICVKPDPPIRKDQTFTYEYGISAKSIYPKIKTDEGDFSSHSVMHQTDLLRFRIYAPDKYRFTRCWIEILDYNGTRDPVEEGICLAECSPKKIHDDTEISWEINDPKITYTYKLYFKVGNAN